MHVLDEAEQPETRVADSLLEASSSSTALLKSDGIANHAVVSELSLVGRKPASSKRAIGKSEHADDANEKG